MAGLEPEIALGLLAPRDDLAGRARQAMAVGHEGAAVGVVDGDGRMGRRRALGQQPLAFGGLGAAIDDDPLLAVIELEAEGAGMGMGIEAGRRRPSGIHQHHGRSGGEAMKAALGRARQGLRLGVGAQQGEIDGAGGTLVAVVEEGQTPVARLEHAQHRRHALDGEHQLARPLSTRGFQRDAQIAEIAQHRELHGGAALDMAAIGQKLARQGAGELLQPGGQQPLMAERERPQDQAFHP